MKLTKARRKLLLIVNSIVLYMAVLCLVSFIKNAPAMRVAEEGVLSATDFTVISDPQYAKIEGSELAISNGGAEKVFAAPVSLEDGIAYQVDFTLECPDGSAGTLNADLFGEGYDNPENEFTQALSPGKNEVSGILPFGDVHPADCQLRIFTLDNVEASISGLRISRMETFSGHSTSEILALLVVLFLAALEAALIYSLLERKNEELAQPDIPLPESKPDYEDVRVDRKELKLDILCAAGIAFGIFVILFFFLGYAKNGIWTPYIYAITDVNNEYVITKAVGQNGWFWNNSFLGAPYGATWLDSLNYVLTNFEALISKIIYMFVQDVFATVNIRFLLTFSLCGISAFCVLRTLSIRRVFSVFGAVCFALAPYIFGRNIEHFCLAACYFVPLSVLLCVWTYEGGKGYLKPGKSFFKNRRNVATILFAFLISNNGIGYYAFFTCFCLAVVALYKFLQQKRLAAISAPFGAICLIVGFSSLALVPSLI